MIAGVVKEIKPGENRVAVTPGGAAAYVAHDHRILVERGAGLGSGLTDNEYEAAGARIAPDADAVWGEAELVIKVKEPLSEEIARMRPGQILYTYLHLASAEDLTRALLDKGVIAIGYETVQLDDGSLPLLAPMSEVAGRLAVQKGAQCLEAHAQGRGVLLSGASGVRPGEAVILGAGIVGANACHIALGMGARVTIMDINTARLRYVYDIMGSHVTTLVSNRAALHEALPQADLVIGAVLIPGARAPQLITEGLVREMRTGAVIVDTAIDQGGCCATARPTTHAEPTYAEHGVVHYCVTNMPAAVPRTSTHALANSTLGYGLMLADKGADGAIAADAALKRGVNVYKGKLVHPAVAESFGMERHAL